MGYRGKRLYKKRKVTARRAVGRTKAGAKRFRYRGTISKNTNIETTMSKIYRPVMLGKGLPQRMKTTLTYRDYVNLSTSSGTNYAEVVIQGNSAYDPNYSGLTRNAQPRYYDQLMTLYNTYRVNASRLKVWVTSGSSTIAGGSFIVVIHLNQTPGQDISAYADNVDALLECNNVISKFVSLAGSEPVTVLTARGTNKGMYPSTGKTDKSFSATSFSNPTSPWFYHVSIWDQARNAVSGSIVAYINVELEFDCEFFDLNNVSPS